MSQPAKASIDVGHVRQMYVPWRVFAFQQLIVHPNNKVRLSVQFSSVTQSCPTLCDPMNRSTPGLPVRHQLPEFTQIHVHWVGDAIQPPHPLSSPSPPAPNPSQHQGLFQWVNSLHEYWPKYWSFSFSVSPSNEHPGLISFRMDWLDFLAVQGVGGFKYKGKFFGWAPLPYMQTYTVHSKWSDENC